ILRQVRAGQDPEASACAFDDVRPFLDAFFPEDAGDLEVGAAALVRQSRSRSLAQQRIGRGLAQWQVAERMGAPPDRVAEIEDADPGSLDLAELARYVEAIGGRLEVTANFGAERVTLA
ncbi:MAG TPA: hypothetical protein VF834_21280, partial [Streptosporangiaceae bacterium]